MTRSYNKLHLGVDYGSKLAGTTAICYHEKNQLIIINSEKKKNADQFITDTISILKPNAIYLDAPLSLPGAYTSKGSDFHYRECDRLTAAMSPMFLGGLTARAMSLRQQNRHCTFHECYPSYLVKEVLGAKEYYKKKERIPNSMIVSLIQDIIEMKIPALESYHQLDAVLCWLTGNRHMKNEHLLLGDEAEGLIIV